jgi:6-pyruvoyltetrahydropterin/6-carboxytetrahydropterin synthase
MTVVLERIYRFSAAHLYRRPEWSEEENRRRFGRCSWPPGHGHNYRLTVRVAGEPEPATGFVIGLPELDRWVAERVLDRVDHRHLNEALEEFGPGGRVPSSENLVLWMRARLSEGLPEGCRLVGLRLAEDDDLAACWEP